MTRLLADGGPQSTATARSFSAHAVWLLCLMIGGCYSTSLLTTPWPTPPKAIRSTLAVSGQHATKRHSDNAATPFPEASVRFGLRERADVGLKLGPAYVDLNSVVRLTGRERWVLSALPGVGLSWLWEGTTHSDDPEGLDKKSAFERSPTRVAALKLPLLFGWESRHIGLMFGPTVHTGYRFCRDSAGSTNHAARDTSAAVCSNSDNGAFLAVGGHFGLQVPLGSFVKIMPELGVLGLPLAPAARVVGPDDVRASFSQGQIITHVALGVQLGRFVREPKH